MYSDGTEDRIAQSEGQEYVGAYPIFVDETTKEIKLIGILFDKNTKSLTIDTDTNRIGNDVQGAIVAGKGNEVLTPYQHVEGPYANINSQYAFIIGNGVNDGNRANLFVITFDGISHISTDFTAGGSIDNPTYRLSDIHSVLDVDWAFIGYDGPDFNDDFSDDYDSLEIVTPEEII